MAFIDKTMAVAADVQDVQEVWKTFEDYPEFMAGRAVLRSSPVAHKDPHRP